ncbi:MAG: hypothetical protein ACI9W4_002988, partial [Rhodothermales bacterium]
TKPQSVRAATFLRRKSYVDPKNKTPCRPMAYMGFF